MQWSMKGRRALGRISSGLAVGLCLLTASVASAQQVVDMRSGIRSAVDAVVQVRIEQPVKKKTIMNLPPNVSPQTAELSIWPTYPTPTKHSYQTGIVVGVVDQVLTSFAKRPAKEEKLSIRTRKGEWLSARLLAYDAGTGLALLKTPAAIPGADAYQPRDRKVELGMPVSTVWRQEDGRVKVGQGIVATSTAWSQGLRRVSFETNITVAMQAA